MSCERLLKTVLVAVVGVALVTFAAGHCIAQDGGADGGADGGTSGDGGVFNPNPFAPAGVEVDAAGVLRMRLHRDPTGQLSEQRRQQSRAALNPDLARRSPLRKVSLNRLEQALARCLADTGTVSEEMQYLAGLTRLKYVFYFPETSDIVIAGPAEGYAQDLSGRIVGLHTGQSVLELQDLIVALRAFPPLGNPTPVISCSIDPTRQGLERMQKFLVQVAGNIQPGDANRVAAGLRQSLGLQDVTIGGISPRTHFAQVLVEADYRMKLIGIGLETPAVDIKSYVQRANPSQVARNAMQRWYFVPDYNKVRTSEDGLAMELVGNGVQLVDEDELVTQQGNRSESTRVNRASRGFVRDFTDKFDELAQRSPVFSQLRNLIDMSVAAAYIQHEDYYGKADWSMRVLGNEVLAPVENFQAPEHVESAVNVIWKGRTLMTPIGGGVNIQPQLALNSDVMLDDEDGRLREQHEQIGIDQLDETTWWWD